jgi:hypothetical protein
MNLRESLQKKRKIGKLGTGLGNEQLSAITVQQVAFPLKADG